MTRRQKIKNRKSCYESDEIYEDNKRIYECDNFRRDWSIKRYYNKRFQKENRKWIEFLRIAICWNEKKLNITRIENSMTITWITIAFFDLLRVRFVTIKNDRSINWNRFVNEKTALRFTRNRFAKFDCVSCKTSAKIFWKCVVMSRFLKEFCINCYYSFEDEKCSLKNDL
jgi:hypothetical protein